MDAILLQDWTTLRGAGSVAKFTQSETGWADVTAYQDVVAWLDVKEFSTSNAAITYQTSPSKDDSLFVSMLLAPVALATGVTTTAMLKDAMPASLPPCSKWIRWQIVVTGGVAWDITFRIWLAANRIGNRAALSEAATLGDLDQEGNAYAYGILPNYGPQSSQGSQSGSSSGPPYWPPQSAGPRSNVPAPTGSTSIVKPAGGSGW